MPLLSPLSLTCPPPWHRCCDALLADCLDNGHGGRCEAYPVGLWVAA